MKYKDLSLRMILGFLLGYLDIWAPPGKKEYGFHIDQYCLQINPGNYLRPAAKTASNVLYFKIQRI